MKYDAFGNITAESDAPVEFRHAYTGQEWDADAGMYNYGARWYEAVTALFASEDRRQYVFRQPAGKDWRNTVGQLAPHVDSRANGGYATHSRRGAEDDGRVAGERPKEGPEFGASAFHLPSL